MSTTPFTLPVPGGTLTINLAPGAGTLPITFVPTSGTNTTPVALPPIVLPNLPGLNPSTIPGLPAELSALLPTLTTALGAANPQIALIVTLLGIVFQIGQAIHTQAAAQPAGSNPSIETALQHFFTTLTTAFPLPQLGPPTPATPAAA